MSHLLKILFLACRGVEYALRDIPATLGFSGLLLPFLMATRASLLCLSLIQMHYTTLQRLSTKEIQKLYYPITCNSL
ncbi:hypothetical protein BDP55DRAFT_656156 [Colletotrichum godetiae]|uniref:Uncharacterized protein n=1 Tax=Colletotrichum godetiae TaxID=1209918 RepID=A0AAJ0AQI0_9PEZI|nr:uncharacterized protein BDP55DRAFT_656156 [Colletotrichum godetiae]KAK1688506.1 hypothetical protein BDP55DRAFT_656156 [Colletotrichum godetiae]